MNKQEMLTSFQTPEEKLLFSKVLDRLFLCIQKGENTFTDFMDPVKAGKFLAVIKKHSFPQYLHKSYGGLPDCERRMVGFSMEEELKDSDFPIEAVEIHYHSKFSRVLTHRDFLGSILGLGIVREKIGDIFCEKGRGVVLVSREIAGYVCANLEKVANASVKTSIIKAEQAAVTETERIKKQITLTSMRLDNIISAAFHLSRGKASDLIAGEKVFVNWMPTTQISKTINEKDIITIRGMGRVHIDEIVGWSKKDKIILRIVMLDTGR